LLNFALLLCHKTMGGWQFGARYTVDLLPFALFYLLLGGRRALRGWELAVGVAAILFNAYGALALTVIP
jgi:hypothetical protein